MLSVDSKLWKLRSCNCAYMHITQCVSGITRTVLRGQLPSDVEIALMSEWRFNSVCRDAFNGEIKLRA
jgi:hypothetical protein